MGGVLDKYGVYIEKNEYGCPIYTGMSAEFYTIIENFAYRGLNYKEIAGMLDIPRKEVWELNTRFDGAIDRAIQRGKARLTNDTVGKIQETANNDSYQSLEASKFIYTQICRPQKQRNVASEESKYSIDLDYLKKIVSDSKEELIEASKSVKDI